MFYKIAGIILIFLGISVSLIAGELIISEICIVPENDSFPRWVELKSESSKEINLKGFKLYDKNECIYGFDRNIIILPGEYVLICFYKEKNTSEEFKKLIPPNVKVVDIFQKEVFKPINIRKIEPRLKALTLEWLRNNAGKKMSTKRENELMDMAVKNIKPYLDELAILDPSENIIDFVRWGDYNLERAIPECSPRRAAAQRKKMWVEQLLIPYSPVFLRETQYEYTQLNDYKDASPGTYLKENKSPLKNISISTGLTVTLHFAPIKSMMPWGIELELSEDENFKNIKIRKNWDGLYDECGLGINFNDEEAEFLNKHKIVYFRARRILSDKTKTSWVTGKAQIDLQEIDDLMTELENNE